MASTTEFSRTLSLLRQERGVSQRTAAGDLGISQALLSHYENGIREPGLAFVVKACDYYHVSADFILGRTLSREGNMLTEQEILNATEPGNILQGSVLATLQSKLLSGAVGVLFGLLFGQFQLCGHPVGRLARQLFGRRTLPGRCHRLVFLRERARPRHQQKGHDGRHHLFHRRK